MDFWENLHCFGRKDFSKRRTGWKWFGVILSESNLPPVRDSYLEKALLAIRMRVVPDRYNQWEITVSIMPIYQYWRCRRFQLEYLSMKKKTIQRRVQPLLTIGSRNTYTNGGNITYSLVFCWRGDDSIVVDDETRGLGIPLSFEELSPGLITLY